MRFCLEGRAFSRKIHGEMEDGRETGRGKRETYYVPPDPSPFPLPPFPSCAAVLQLELEHNMSEQNQPSRLDEQAVRDALKVVKDPEVGISIIDLGLVYDVEIDAGKVDVKMTLTSPGCPVGPQIMQEADETVRGLAGVKDVRIELVWEPYWTPERINPKVRAYLGM